MPEPFKGEEPALPEGTDETRVCSICLSRERCVLAKPCNHLALCVTCTLEYDKQHSAAEGLLPCPICKKAVKKFARVFAS